MAGGSDKDSSGGHRRSQRLRERLAIRRTEKAADLPATYGGIGPSRWPWLTVASRGSMRDLPSGTLATVARTVEVADVHDLETAAPDLLLLEAPSQGGPPQVGDPEHLPLLMHCEQQAIATIMFAATPSDARGPVAHTVRVVASVDPEVSAVAREQVGPERATTIPIIADTWTATPVPRGRSRRQALVVLGDHAAHQEPSRRGLDAKVELLAADAEELLGNPARLRMVVERAGAAVAPLTDLTLDEQRLIVVLASNGVPVVAAQGGSTFAEGLTISPGDDPFVTARFLLEDDHQHEVASITARRAALLHHGPDVALGALLSTAGVPLLPASSVSLLAPIANPSLLPRLRDSAARQHHERIEVVVTTHERHLPAVSAEVRGWERATEVIAVPSSARRGDHLNVAAAAAGGEYVAILDPRAIYGPFHVTDLLLALRHSRADLAGRFERFVYDGRMDATARLKDGCGEAVRGQVAAGTMLMSRELTLRSGFARKASAPDAHLAKRIVAHGGSVYAAHPFDTLLPGRIVMGDGAAEAVTPGEDLPRALPFGDGGVPFVPHAGGRAAQTAQEHR